MSRRRGRARSPSPPRIRQREWFAVRYGSKLLTSDKHINIFVSQVEGFLKDHGSTLRPLPFVDTIYQENNLQKLMGTIQRVLNAIENITKDRPTGPFVPLLIVADDQTLDDLGAELRQKFSEHAFILNLRTHILLQSINTNDWAVTRDSAAKIAQLAADVDPQEPIPEHELEEPSSSYGHQQQIHAPYDESEEFRRQEMDHDTFTVERSPDTGYQESFQESPRGRHLERKFLTTELIHLALNNCNENPDVMDSLAEDLDGCDMARALQEPWETIDDELDLLQLVLLSGENGGFTDEKLSRRKGYTLMLISTGFLSHVISRSLSDMRPEYVDAKSCPILFRALQLLWRSFELITDLDLNGEEGAVELFTKLDTTTFRSLPSAFWNAISERDAYAIFRQASAITGEDVSTFSDLIFNMEGKNDTHEAQRDEWNEGREHGHYRDAHARGDDGRFEEERRKRDEEEDERRREEELRREEEWREEERRKEEERRRNDLEERRRMEEVQAIQRQQQQSAVAFAQNHPHGRQMETEDANRVAWAACEESEPPCPYRSMADRPVIADVINPKRPYLRRAITDGHYTSADHYLDVQFRLLREDMVSPLRDQLNIYKCTGIYRSMPSWERSKVKAVITQDMISDLVLFRNVRVSRVQIQGRQGEKMRFVKIPDWSGVDPSKKLCFGQVVALSSDDFAADVHMALIVERPDEALPGGRATFDGRLCIALFEEGTSARKSTKAALHFDTNKLYTMVEPGSYFEAYHHVLKVLKKFRRYTEIPFERYLVHGKTDGKLPRYMRIQEKEEHKKEDQQRREKYIQEKLADQKKKKERDEKEKKRKQKMLEVKRRQNSGDSDEKVGEAEEEDSQASEAGYSTDEEEECYDRKHTTYHPNPQAMEKITIRGTEYSVEKMLDEFKPDYLDESQRQAMCYALTSELSVIQGPPGTGKTHIGVEIVRTILENRIRWRMTTPILIVTFTNQALDQFLERILNMIRIVFPEGTLDTPEMVRLGGRSESAALSRQAVMAKDVMDTFAGRDAVREIVSRETDSLYTQKQRNKRARCLDLLTAVRIIRDSRKSILNYITLRAVMGPQFEMQMRQEMAVLSDSNGNPLNHDEGLACWLLDKNFAQRRELPGAADGDDFGRKENKKKEKEKKTGRETKAEQRERRRKEKAARWNGGEEDSSDDEDEKEEAWIGEEGDDDEGDQLERQLRQLQLEAKQRWKSEEDAAAIESMGGIFELEEKWEMERRLERERREGPDDHTIFSGDGGTKNLGKRDVKVDNVIVASLKENVDSILAMTAMTTEDVARIHDIRTISKIDRWKLVVYWQEKVASHSRGALEARAEQYRTACRQADAVTRRRDAEVFRKALIVGATTTGLAKRRHLLGLIAPKVIVVEEAAEVLEGHILASLLPSLQHAIFIGDHQQLRPSAAVNYLAQNANLEVSMFERLIKNGYPYRTLLLQHRMLPELTKLIVRPHFYKELEDDPSVSLYPEVLGMKKRLFFWAHNVNEDRLGCDETSRKNEYEVLMVEALVPYLLMQRQYSQEQITVIATYAMQVSVLKRRFAERGLSEVQIETVDSYQGKENRIVILSLVRSNSDGVGFLSVSNRICVALTRAQHAFYTVGNINYIAEKSWLWDNIRASIWKAGPGEVVDWGIPLKCQTHGTVQQLRVPSEYKDIAPEGGCTQKCLSILNCGHHCQRRCHPPCEHDDATIPSECAEQCLKKCDRCGCRCTKQCGQSCGICYNRISLPLSCEHSVEIECYAANNARCARPCERVLECGHRCSKRCGDVCIPVENCEAPVMHTFARCKHESAMPCHSVNREIVKVLPGCIHRCNKKMVCGHDCQSLCSEPCPLICTVEVERTLKFCGHKATMPCSQNTLTWPCKIRVPSSMTCGHSTQVNCSDKFDPTKCTATCDALVPGCGHRCSRSCGTCHADNGTHLCSQKCALVLPCGHGCHSGCGRSCAPCDQSCRTQCSHMKCGLPGANTTATEFYGRRCNDPCVMCDQICENSCEHRACGQRCFEVCDVQACEEKCMKKLPCGHRCMGMCGEICPKTCASCNRDEYSRRVDRFLGSSAVSSVHTFIVTPCCGDMPTEYLDNAVREQQNEFKTIVTCPKCKSPLIGIKRYIRTQRRMLKRAEEDKMAPRTRTPSGARNVFKDHMRIVGDKQKEFTVLLGHFKIKVTKGGGSRLLQPWREIMSMAADMATGVRMKLDTEKDDSSLHYWDVAVPCFVAIIDHVMAALDQSDFLRVLQVADNPPAIKGVILDAFDGRRRRDFMMKENYQGLMQSLVKSTENKKAGVVVPAVRKCLIRCLLAFHAEQLYSHVRGVRDLARNNTPDEYDLPFDTARALRNIITGIQKKSSHEFPENDLQLLVDRIRKDVYEKEPFLSYFKRMYLRPVAQFDPASLPNF